MAFGGATETDTSKSARQVFEENRDSLPGAGIDPKLISFLVRKPGISIPGQGHPPDGDACGT